MIKEMYIFGDQLIDQQTKDQFETAMDYDDACMGALMPDAHFGYTMPIGGVIGTQNTVLPSWVGYDIGCGMTTIETTYTMEDVIACAEAILYTIYEEIPLGMGKYYDRRIAWPGYYTLKKSEWLSKNWYDMKGFKQIGSMGANNHFIEIGAAARDHKVWITVHSGSRGVGYKTAAHYIKKAHPENKQKEGSYGFDINSQEGQDYINDHHVMRKFAEFSRMHMLKTTSDIIGNFMDGGMVRSSMINSTHNVVDYSKDLELWVHRKGAINASIGYFHIIPANRADGVFVVEPTPYKPALNSCSHGAGRAMSRKRANELLVSDYCEQMDGITGIVDDTTIEEAPNAYKNAYQVMAAQADMCRVFDVIEPLISIKAQAKKRGKKSEKSSEKTNKGLDKSQQATTFGI